MGADHAQPPTELREYLALLWQRDGTGQPFIIVGGHAANLWAEFYSESEPKFESVASFCQQGPGFDWHRGGSGASGKGHRLVTVAATNPRRACVSRLELDRTAAGTLAGLSIVAPRELLSAKAAVPGRTIVYLPQLFHVARHNRCRFMVIGRRRF